MNGGFFAITMGFDHNNRYNMFDSVSWNYFHSPREWITCEERRVFDGDVNNIVERENNSAATHHGRKIGA